MYGLLVQVKNVLFFLKYQHNKKRFCKSKDRKQTNCTVVYEETYLHKNSRQFFADEVLLAVEDEVSVGIIQVENVALSEELPELTNYVQYSMLRRELSCSQT